MPDDDSPAEDSPDENVPDENVPDENVSDENVPLFGGAIEFAGDEVVPIADLVSLYEAVGWLIYAADPDALARAVDNSTYVTTARDGDGELIGLARCLSDDVSIMYLQDVLVHPDHRRSRIGSVLVGACVDRFDHVRQKVLLTDAEPSQHGFYRSLGFTDLADLAPISLHTFVQIEGLEPVRHDDD